MNHVPPCSKCIFYRPERTGICIRYVAYRGRGKLVYDFAQNARNDERKCGSTGFFFVPREKNAQSLRQWNLLEEDE